jgi:phage terminase small subunit
MRGRPRKPTALHIVEGTDRAAVRRQRAGEPDYEATAPPMPEAIARDEVAARWWRHYVGLLGPAGVLNASHGSALTVLAHLAADFERVREDMAKPEYQRLVGGGEGQGRLRPNPLNAEAERLGTNLIKVLAEFGLTPISKAKVGGKTPGPVDPFEQFLGGGRPK